MSKIDLKLTKMNSSNSIKSLTSKLNSALKLYYSPSRNKIVEQKIFPTTFNVLKESGNLLKNSGPRYDFDCSNLDDKNDEKLCSVISKIDLPFSRKIIDPGIKIKIQVPLQNIRIRELDLPCNQNREMVDPTNDIIEKKAENMLAIRRKKIKKHKRKKFLKRMKFELRKKRQEKYMRAEIKFQNNLKAILAEGKNFSAEKYVDGVINRINEEIPVTKVRGFVAPSEVIKEYLDNQRYEKIIEERVQECINFKKK